MDDSEEKLAAHIMPARVLLDRGPQQGSACVQPLWKGTSLMAVDFLSNYIVGTFLEQAFIPAALLVGGVARGCKDVPRRTEGLHMGANKETSSAHRI